MKRIVVGSTVLLVITLALLNCNVNGSGKQGISMIPVIGSSGFSGKGMASSKSIAVSTSSVGGYDFNIMAGIASVPVITGWTTNMSSVTSNETFTSTVLNQTVTTTISTSGDDDIFNGVFSDGQGIYKITHHKSANTFDFSQTVIYVYTDTVGGTGTSTLMMVISMNGVAINSDGSYSGNGQCYCAAYQAGSSYNAIVFCSYKIISNTSITAELATTANYAYPNGVSAPDYSNNTLINDMTSLVYNTSGSNGCLGNNTVLQYYQNGAWNMKDLDGPANGEGSQYTATAAQIQTFWTSIGGQ